MQHIFDMIRENGDVFYLITFIWTALEGETFVIFAALAAQHGLLNIWALFLAAWLGSFCGDQVYFFLGRRYGTRVVERFPHLKPKLDKVFGWLERYAVLFILSYRFMYGVRNVSGLAIGMSKLPWRKFAVLNALAAFVWAAVFCSVGYLFGDVIEHLSRRRDEIEGKVNFAVREFMLVALVLAVVAVVLRVLFLKWRRKHLDRLAELGRIAQEQNPGLSADRDGG